MLDDAEIHLITDPRLGTEDFRDEFLSINAIYGDDTFAHVANTAFFSLKITIPGLEPDSSIPYTDSGAPSIALKLSIPLQYPSIPPRIISILSLGESQALRGYGKEIVDSATKILDDSFQTHCPVIADLIEGLEPVIADLLHTTRIGQPDKPSLQDQEPEPQSTPVPDLGPAPEWVVSDPITERKSVFVARLVRVSTVDEAKQSLTHLLSTDKKVARATHNVSAWRIRGPGSVIGSGIGSRGGSGGGHASYQDCDDDGETAAGGRLLHLLQLTDVWDVMVVVSRWFGGIHLGPARFKLLNSAARDVLVKAGLVESPT